MNIKKQIIILLVLYVPFISFAEDNRVKEDKQHIKVWNTFAEELYQLHKLSIKNIDVRIEQESGGYPGNKNFFRELRYHDSDSGKLISRIQRETANTGNIHLIEVFLYDKQGRVRLDYLAAFLPEFRNAPIQTLINVHHYNDLLHSYRQFDASGALIYEQCRGKLFGETVFITLDEDEINDRHNILKTESENEQYFSCFESVPRSAKHFIKPLQQFDNSRLAKSEENDKDIKKVSEEINAFPENSALYVQRGDLYFNRHEFEKAVVDYSEAIKLDDNADEAYFGRGMALGRQGLIQQGINDLSTYIKRHPYNSRAYTKRGVRYIWLGNLPAAKEDMLEAISLDITNAEAHDDLGVIYASESNFDKAIYHFKQSVYYDRSYQKAYHNLAMAYLMTDSFARALTNINKGLKLDKDNRNSLLLKSAILQKLGKLTEATKLKEYAEFLPEGNWSERFTAK